MIIIFLPFAQTPYPLPVPYFLDISETIFNNTIGCCVNTETGGASEEAYQGGLEVSDLVYTQPPLKPIKSWTQLKRPPIVIFSEGQEQSLNKSLMFHTKQFNW